jgi:hypothetical protein
MSGHHADVSQCCCPCSASSEVSESQTHASLANHSCVAPQCGQWVCPKNTGLERKAAASTCVPVEIARPVFEQRIIRIPIRHTPGFGWRMGIVHLRRKDKSPMAIHGFSCGGVIAASMCRWVQSRSLTAEADPLILSRRQCKTVLCTISSGKFLV